MMATTHALVGLVAAALVGLVAPAHAPLALAAGFAGGLAPDLDLYAGHRRTLHFPVCAWPFVAVLFAAAATGGGPVAAAGAAFLLAAALHATMDVFGGGLELRPWQANSPRAVYNHLLGRWHSPRRWVRYDGAPEDVVLGAVVAVPAYLLAAGPLRRVVVATLVVSVGYAAVRRRVPALTAWLVGAVPVAYRPYLPARFLDG
jgi:hypothetical protein